jgi:hypothetical protein
MAELKPVADRDSVVTIVSEETRWMIKQRMGKLREAMLESMSVMPFLMPILFDIHGATGMDELGELLVVGHLMVGHSTSFGKLLDEKVLPKAFKTEKLTGQYREANPPFKEACFNEIDHLIKRPDGPILLSLKASRWTIQLTNAVGLNKAFHEILTKYSPPYNRIVVGVYAGTQANLTDKYEILRGINRGKQHNVVDLTGNVLVYAGREFWAWLNGGETATQDWILDGVLKGLREADCRKECAELLKAFKAGFNAYYAKYINSDKTVNWHELLIAING